MSTSEHTVISESRDTRAVSYARDQVPFFALDSQYNNFFGQSPAIVVQTHTGNRPFAPQTPAVVVGPS